MTPSAPVGLEPLTCANDARELEAVAAEATVGAKVASENPPRSRSVAGAGRFPADVKGMSTRFAAGAWRVP